MVFAAMALTSSLAVATVRTDAHAVVTEQAQRVHAVGISTETYIDTHRPTAERADRGIAHPDSRDHDPLPRPGVLFVAPPLAGAIPYCRGGRHLLIVFAHGLGADPGLYLSLLSSWAAAGFVVAAPSFPLTNNHTPDGPDAGDVTISRATLVRHHVRPQNIRAARRSLSGRIDPQEIRAPATEMGRSPRSDSWRTRAATTIASRQPSSWRGPRRRSGAVTSISSRHHHFSWFTAQSTGSSRQRSRAAFNRTRAEGLAQHQGR